MPDALTERQREILDFITSSIAERGYPPTLREIGEHFGLLTMELVHGVDFRTALCGGGAEPARDYERLAAALVEWSA